MFLCITGQNALGLFNFIEIEKGTMFSKGPLLKINVAGYCGQCVGHNNGQFKQCLFLYICLVNL